MAKSQDDKVQEDNVEKDVYSEEGLESLEENDEISPEEAGFMEGEEGKGEGTICQGCGKVIPDDGRVIERDIHGKINRFCSLTCAERQTASSGNVKKSIKPDVRIGDKKSPSKGGRKDA